MNVLIIAAHPDDEVLGCGGVIAKHSDLGHSVNILIVGEGFNSRLHGEVSQQAASEDVLCKLKRSAEDAARILGAENVKHLDLPDNRLDSLDRLDLIRIIEGNIEYFRPNVVYVHHAGDVNIDHRRLHEAVVTACRPIPGHVVKRLLSFEVASSTEWQPPASSRTFQPNWFVDITEQLPRKLEALIAYNSEMRQWPHARSIEALEHLARWRGAQVGVEAAEAFCLLRQVI